MAATTKTTRAKMEDIIDDNEPDITVQWTVKWMGSGKKDESEADWEEI